MKKLQNIYYINLNFDEKCYNFDKCVIILTMSINTLYNSKPKERSDFRAIAKAVEVVQIVILTSILLQVSEAN